MRKKKVALLCTAILACTPMTVQANDVEQLYDYYSVEAPEIEQFDKYDIITTYQEAQCASVKYSAVRNVDPHLAELVKRQKELSVRLTELEKELLGAYDLSFPEIVSLESEYKATETKLRSIELCLSISEIDVDLNFSAVPSRAEYLAARRELDDYMSSLELGTVPYTDVVSNPVKITEGSSYDWVYTEKGMSVVLLYNGMCTEVTDTSATFECGNGVTVIYTNLDSTCVSIGQSVNQGEPVGRSSDMVGVSLLLNGQHVSIFKHAELGGNDETNNIQNLRN